MTSVSRLGDRTSGRQEETIRLGLTEAEAETLGMFLTHVGGANGKNGPGSRRVHVERILVALSEIGVLTLDEDFCPAEGAVSFSTTDDFDRPLLFEEEGVKFL